MWRLLHRSSRAADWREVGRWPTRAPALAALQAAEADLHVDGEALRVLFPSGQVARARFLVICRNDRCGGHRVYHRDRVRFCRRGCAAGMRTPQLLAMARRSATLLNERRRREGYERVRRLALHLVPASVPVVARADVERALVEAVRIGIAKGWDIRRNRDVARARQARLHG